jgi:hypothetical protein
LSRPLESPNQFGKLLRLLAYLIHGPFLPRSCRWGVALVDSVTASEILPDSLLCWFRWSFLTSQSDQDSLGDKDSAQARIGLCSTKGCGLRGKLAASNKALGAGNCPGLAESGAPFPWADRVFETDALVTRDGLPRAERLMDLWDGGALSLYSVCSCFSICSVSNSHEVLEGSTRNATDVERRAAN